MKKLQLVLVTLMIACMSSSCKTTKGVTNFDEFGTYVFSILKDFDNLTKNSYVNTVVTADEIKTFGEQNAATLSPKNKKDIDGLNKKDYTIRMARDYYRINERAEKAGISWDTIEYVNYKYDFTDEGGMRSNVGT
ncbi:MAG: hypothetical protein AAF617_05960, partial [Bacteroidota bacterium]